VSATAKSTTSDTTCAIKSITSKSKPMERETKPDELKPITSDVIKSQSPEKEVKRLRFPCSYCSRRFETLEQVKRHIRYAHTPRRTT
jgi:transcriptional regulator NrdR family protein